MNQERDCDSHHQYIHHINSVLSRDLRHRIQFGYHIISVPRYIPTTAELCTTLFGKIVDKIKEDLAYFKEDLRNPSHFIPISRQNIPQRSIVAPSPMDTTLSTSTPTFTEDSQLGPQGDPTSQGTTASGSGDNTVPYLITPSQEDTTGTPTPPGTLLGA